MLGQTFVKAFAKEGAKIALLVRSLDKASPLLAEIRADGGIIAAYPSDVINKESLRKARELINQELGTCHILINGAGDN